MIFNKLTRSFVRPTSYDDLVKITVNAFGQSQLPQGFKFFYSDEEGDIISITCQEDYEEAIENNSALIKLVIDTCASSAKFIMPIASEDSPTNDNSKGAMFGFSTNSVVFEDVSIPASSTTVKKVESPKATLLDAFVKGESINSDYLNLKSVQNE